MSICFGNFLCNMHILLQKIPLHLQIFALSKLRKTLKPCFFDDFGAWRSPSSVDFARATSAESAKKQGFRAGSDDSLLPNDF
ncbi:MAG: hypothetical protein J6B09_02425 [Clostridia bacterium]|nr:hypothetical protein [Clostridia bacterium]